MYVEENATESDPEFQILNFFTKFAGEYNLRFWIYRSDSVDPYRFKGKSSNCESSVLFCRLHTMLSHSLMPVHHSMPGSPRPSWTATAQSLNFIFATCTSHLSVPKLIPAVDDRCWDRPHNSVYSPKLTFQPAISYNSHSSQPITFILLWCSQPENLCIHQLAVGTRHLSFDWTTYYVN
jgi:hypothetical protein